MKGDDYFFKFYYQKITMSCKSWSDEKFGAYVRLLIEQFDRGGLPDDEDELKGMIKSYKKSWPLLKDKFKKCDDGLLRQPFMAMIREERDRKKTKLKENGVRGGRPKKSESDEEKKPNGFPENNQMVSKKKPNGLHIEVEIEEEVEIEREKDLTLYKIEDCFTIALKDERWVRAAKVTPEKLADFNRFLESQAQYMKNPADYKKHFSNWVKKSASEFKMPEQVPGPTLRRIN